MEDGEIKAEEGDISYTSQELPTVNTHTAISYTEHLTHANSVPRVHDLLLGARVSITTCSRSSDSRRFPAAAQSQES